MSNFVDPVTNQPLVNPLDEVDKALDRGDLETAHNLLSNPNTASDWAARKANFANEMSQRVAAQGPQSGTPESIAQDIPSVQSDLSIPSIAATVLTGGLGGLTGAAATAARPAAGGILNYLGMGARAGTPKIAGGVTPAIQGALGGAAGTAGGFITGQVGSEEGEKIAGTPGSIIGGIVGGIPGGILGHAIASSPKFIRSQLPPDMAQQARNIEIQKALPNTQAIPPMAEEAGKHIGDIIAENVATTGDRGIQGKIKDATSIEALLKIKDDLNKSNLNIGIQEDFNRQINNKLLNIQEMIDKTLNTDNMIARIQTRAANEQMGYKPGQANQNAATNRMGPGLVDQSPETKLSDSGIPDEVLTQPGINRIPPPDFKSIFNAPEGNQDPTLNMRIDLGIGSVIAKVAKQAYSDPGTASVADLVRKATALDPAQVEERWNARKLSLQLLPKQADAINEHFNKIERGYANGSIGNRDPRELADVLPSVAGVLGSAGRNNQKAVYSAMDLLSKIIPKDLVEGTNQDYVYGKQIDNPLLPRSTQDQQLIDNVKKYTDGILDMLIQHSDDLVQRGIIDKPYATPAMRRPNYITHLWNDAHELFGDQISDFQTHDPNMPYLKPRTGQVQDISLIRSLTAYTYAAMRKLAMTEPIELLKGQVIPALDPRQKVLATSAMNDALGIPSNLTKDAQMIYGAVITPWAKPVTDAINKVTENLPGQLAVHLQDPTYLGTNAWMNQQLNRGLIGLPNTSPSLTHAMFGFINDFKNISTRDIITDGYKGVINPTETAKLIDQAGHGRWSFDNGKWIDLQNPPVVGSKFYTALSRGLNNIQFSAINLADSLRNGVAFQAALKEADRLIPQYMPQLKDPGAIAKLRTQWAIARMSQGGVISSLPGSPTMTDPAVTAFLRYTRPVIKQMTSWAGDVNQAARFGNYGPLFKGILGVGMVYGIARELGQDPTEKLLESTGVSGGGIGGMGWVTTIAGMLGDSLKSAGKSIIGGDWRPDMHDLFNKLSEFVPGSSGTKHIYNALTEDQKKIGGRWIPAPSTSQKIINSVLQMRHTKNELEQEYYRVSEDKNLDKGEKRERLRNILDELQK